MKVKRIVANIDTQEITAAKCFYQDVLELDLLMDHDWIRTYGSREEMNFQISFASQGGSNTPTPDLCLAVEINESIYKREIRDIQLEVKL